MALTRRILTRALVVLMLLLLWQAVHILAGSSLVPSVTGTMQRLWGLLLSSDSWISILVTFFRVVTGLGLGVVLATSFAVPGFTKRSIDEALSPLVFAIQACPTIIWISIVLVWSGNGSIVPITAVSLVAFPVLYFNMMLGARSINVRLFKMTRLYRVPTLKVLRCVLVPGIAPSFVAGFAYASSISWKVAVTAEFISSGKGVGSELYWAYRKLDMEALFCWTSLLVCAGVLIEAVVVRPLRERYRA